MTSIIKTLYLVIGVILFIILSWLIVIPEDIIRTKIEDSISDSVGRGFNASISGLRKTILFSIKTDSLIIKEGQKEVAKISGLTIKFNPLYLFKRRLRLYVDGRIGDGRLRGDLIPPENGILKINGVGLDQITYLNPLGFKGDGEVSGDIHIRDGITHIRFEVLDLNITDTGNIFFPLADTFHELQGAVTIHGDAMDIDSIGLEGEKGYARIKGNIHGRNIRATLELMPYPHKLTQIESMLISRYQISPGYYKIPIKVN